MSSCSTIRTDSRIRSTPSPARNASSNSDTADWDNAIGGLLFSVCLAVHTEDPADGAPASAGHAVDHPKPHHARGLTPRGRGAAPATPSVDGREPHNSFARQGPVAGTPAAAT